MEENANEFANLFILDNGFKRETLSIPRKNLEPVPSGIHIDHDYADESLQFNRIPKLEPNCAEEISDRYTEHYMEEVEEPEEKYTCLVTDTGIDERYNFNSVRDTSSPMYSYTDEISKTIRGNSVGVLEGNKRCGESSQTINPKKRRYKKKTEWTKAAENLLVVMWEAKIMQLRKNRKNQHVYAEIAAELQKSGCAATALDVKTKVHNLTARYRKEKLLVDPSGNSESAWPLFSQLHSFLGSYKYYNLTEITCDSISAPLPSSAATIEAAAPSTSSAAASFMFDQSEASSDHSKQMGSVASASCSPNTPSSASTHIHSEPASPQMLRESPSPALSMEQSPTATRKPAKREKFQQQIIQRIDNVSQQMDQHFVIMQEIGNKLVNEEREKKELLKALITKQSAVMDAMLHCVNNMK